MVPNVDFLSAMQGRAVLAPMAGVSDLPFRLLCREQGCPFAVTEMVSAKGFLLSPQRTWAHNLLDASPGELTAVQLFGQEPSMMAEAARLLQDGPFCAIDINMGCPAPKITGAGEGSALMRTPQLAIAIVKAVVRAVHLPVTVKMRLGWDDTSPPAQEFARSMEAAGARALYVHGRTRAQMYAGVADREAIAQVVSAVSIPVIANGDVGDVPSFVDMMQRTGGHAVMIGRGAQGNPFLFGQIQAHMQGRAPSMPSREEYKEMALRHAAMLCVLKGEKRGIAQMRTHAASYTKGWQGGAQLRRELHGASTLQELKEALT